MPRTERRSSASDLQSTVVKKQFDSTLRVSNEHPHQSTRPETNSIGSNRTSGTLDLAYLRFLCLHRRLETNEVKLSLTFDEFNSVLATMESLLVLYRAPTPEGTNRALYVVPARLPEYGDEQVLEKHNGSLGLGDYVVRTRCTFRRSFAPPGIIGRFLAFSNDRIMEAKECWQHGAHLVWTPSAHDILVYEVQSVETSDKGRVAYPGLVLCVKGNTAEARIVLNSLVREVNNLLEDKVHGYPGLCPPVFEDTDVVYVRDLTSDLRQYLDIRFEQLGATIRKVAGVTSEVLQALYLAAEEENQYPRLLILKPEPTPRPTVDVRTSPTQLPSPTVCGTEQADGNFLATAEGMQRKTWNKWIQAMKGSTKGRMVFFCEHDMTEVRCGPDGNGYPIEDLPTWVKGCLPLLQVSLFALRVAVGMVSHVDLPLDDLLAAVVASASTEVLGAMGTSISASSLTDAAPLRGESARIDLQPPPKRLQKEGYLALCKFMQRVESPSTTCCGSRFQCSSCGSASRSGCVCVSWKSEMARVSNGKGGLVWVKKTNETAYAEKIAREAERPRNGPHV